jgi:hypothetical protein
MNTRRFEVDYFLIVEMLHENERYQFDGDMRDRTGSIVQSASIVVSRNLLLPQMIHTFDGSFVENIVACGHELPSPENCICLTTPSSLVGMMQFVIKSISQLGVIKAVCNNQVVYLYQPFYIADENHKDVKLDFVVKIMKSDINYTLTTILDSGMKLIDIRLDRDLTADEFFKPILSFRIQTPNNVKRFQNIFKHFHQWGSRVNGPIMARAMECPRIFNQMPLSTEQIEKLRGLKLAYGADLLIGMPILPTSIQQDYCKSLLDQERRVQESLGYTRNALRPLKKELPAVPKYAGATGLHKKST